MDYIFFISALVAIFSVVNPFGSIPFFLYNDSKLFKTG